MRHGVQATCSAAMENAPGFFPSSLTAAANDSANARTARGSSEGGAPPNASPSRL